LYFVKNSDFFFIALQGALFHSTAVIAVTRMQRRQTINLDTSSFLR